MRVADELRDYEYDKAYKPNRPLVRGDVTFPELYWTLGVTAVVLLGFNATLSIARTAALAFIVVHSLVLWVLEKKWGRYRDGMFFALPVWVLIFCAQAVYVCVAHAERCGSAVSMRGALAGAATIFMYLHWEVARKTAWPQSSKPGEKLYSSEVGTAPAMLIAVGFAVLASALMIGLVSPWSEGNRDSMVVWLLAIPPALALFNAVRFLRGRGIAAGPGPLATATYFSFIGLLAFCVIVVRVVHG
ncbi:hypothetical protein LZC95_06440 [Pendulispora brunnea]|uniref:Uncharacterized protein n=1 Tax=Pendulispora brunnea TaxID=2905690 RepID=A0ABZ2KCT8_9BACT